MSFEVRGEDLTAVYERLRAKGLACYSEPQVVELHGYGAMRAIILGDPDGQMIELVQLPSVAEIQRVRAASRAERSKPVA
jgi:hypothetical protein